jgi:uronate dehydrogenase
VEADWDTVLQANIIGCYNMFEAARRQGVQRVVFATTNHVIGFYRRTTRIDHTAPPRPDSRYGVSKAFGEALGRLYADKHGLRVLSIRIGNFADRPADKRRLSIWISPRDFLQLVRIGLEHPELHYEIVYGASDNDRSWWDNSNAYRLGYRPQDESEEFVPDVLAAEPPQPADAVAELFQGGPFCAAEFDGDPLRIE